MAKTKGTASASIDSPLMEGLLSTLAKGERATGGKGKGGFSVDPSLLQPPEPESKEAPTLVKSILNILNGPKDSVERLAFETDPSIRNEYASLYKQKVKLIPDHILKRICIQDDLVASIVQARQNQVSSFGRPREDRFSTGFVIEPKEGIQDRADFTEEKKEEMQKRIDRAIELLSTCGSTEGWGDHEQLGFPQWLSMSCRNAIVVGRLATEIIYTDTIDGEKKFHSFRPIDAGTIYRAAPHQEAANSVRKQALLLLESIKNKDLVPEKYVKDEYAWVQVIDGKPVQAFTAKECVVRNFYPVPDVELDGYPVTPIDTMISAVTTHINITTHNKIYFQSGRATRGMLVIQSDDVDEKVIAHIRQQFNASINSVNNAWRMPVFGVGAEDQISWQPIDSGTRDMEFQYLSDMNARIILSAFQMSPEELPGWSYLSRGTNNQALSESNNEYRLEAHRDLGIRPLLKQFEDFINQVLFPLLDANLAKLCVIKLVGLDAETAEKEAQRIEVDSKIHMDFDEVLETVEKKPVGARWGGKIPLNPDYKAILDSLFTVGEILEHFCGIEGASKDPSLAYRRDPFWFQQVQVQQAAQQMQMQAQQAQAQAAAGVQPGQPGQPGGGGDDGGGGNDGGGGGGAPSNSPAQTENQKTAEASQASAQGQEASGGGQDLSRAIDQVIGALSKSEKQLPAGRRRLLAQRVKTVDHFMEELEKDWKAVSKKIMGVADGHAPRE